MSKLRPVWVSDRLEILICLLFCIAFTWNFKPVWNYKSVTLRMDLMLLRQMWQWFSFSCFGYRPIFIVAPSYQQHKTLSKLIINDNKLVCLFSITNIFWFDGSNTPSKPKIKTGGWFASDFLRYEVNYYAFCFFVLTNKWPNNKAGSQ